MTKLTQRLLFEDWPRPGAHLYPNTAAAASEQDLLALAVALGAREAPGWSDAEEALASQVTPASPAIAAEVREAILGGGDPLGDMFCSLRPAPERRRRGATFTPPGITRSMVDWAEQYATPGRVVDAGSGSGRFLVEAGRRFPQATLLGIELDPLPAILARANLAVWGLASRARVVLGDYRDVPITPVRGRTLYIGNPPYVRHHLIEPHWKQG
jgi:hypothetical protein